MSSAILYLAIVAIWACVLIPRWLRRDSAHGAAGVSVHTAAPDGSAAPAGGVGGAGTGTGTGDAGFADAHADVDAVHETVVIVARSGDEDEAPRPLAAPLSAEDSRRRMLTARRRLLGMLITLEAAAIALAAIGLAALWVVVPPTIMLAGYLLLLREAAHADAEFAQREAEAAAAAAARAQARAMSRREAAAAAAAARTAQRSTPVEGLPLAASLAASFAAAPVPADYEDSGRDFAPGLAGKYTPSNSGAELADVDPYGYEVPRLRAVGD